jgi:hypothetical protein
VEVAECHQRDGLLGHETHERDKSSPGQYPTPVICCVVMLCRWSWRCGRRLRALAAHSRHLGWLIEIHFTVCAPQPHRPEEGIHFHMHPYQAPQGKTIRAVAFEKHCIRLWMADGGGGMARLPRTALSSRSWVLACGLVVDSSIAHGL